MDVDDGFLSLMDDTGNTRDDLKLPDGEIGAEIKQAIAEGRDILVSFHIFWATFLVFWATFLVFWGNFLSLLATFQDLKIGFKYVNCRL